MRVIPDFFTKIKDDAHSTWDLLDSKPEVAGPWRQLFSQVQSPRHVLSELLQNADDSGAQSASARIEDGVFIFEHDGEDFRQEHFASLCRFGFSNKRTLHTIGFRGIGFKSTFSLGPVVEVFSPTIAVKFENKRFTEPIWIPDAPDSPITSIRVKIEDKYRVADLERNLDEWSKSPVSLLFFQNIRKLTISDKSLERKSEGQGLISNSEKVSLIGKESHDVIIIHSEQESFPDDAVDEIRQERITGNEEFTLPPCKVEAVFGLPGSQRLFVILPTDVFVSLPFSCNAPFIQDSARTGIKDPSISPTNRWLLGRLGRLIAQSMTTWLEDKRLELSDRAMAYDLLPKGTQKLDDADQSPSNIVVVNFSAALGKQNILLTSSGKLESQNRIIAPPLFFYKVWTPDQLLKVFDASPKEILAQEVAQPYRDRLSSWGWMKGLNPNDLIERLINSEGVPKPDDWKSLWLLWEFLLVKMHNSLYGKWSKLRIVPIEGENKLFRAEQSIRHSSIKPNISDEDWLIIQSHLHVVDQNWLLYLSGFDDREKNVESGGTKASIANQILEKIGLDKFTDIASIINRAYQDIRTLGEPQKGFLIRFTHILAALDTKIPTNFVFITRDKKQRLITDSLALDTSGDLELILPSAYADSHLLDVDYSSGFSSCTQRQWLDWATSTKSGLQQFVGLYKKTKYYHRKSELKDYLYTHEGIEPSEYPYKGEHFVILEYDFDTAVLAHWQNQSKTDKTIWTKVVRLIITDPNRSWKRMIKAELYQRANNGSEKPLVCNNLKSSWIIRLRNYECLEDSNGIQRVPSDLLMLSTETELLMGVELFVRRDLDTEFTRDLLQALGVRATPASIGSIIQRLKIFSTSQNPPAYELEKIFVSIDRLLPKCSTQGIEQAKEIFASEPLIFSDQGTWCISKDIFQNPDPHDNSGVPLILPQLRHLQLWGRIGVAEKPTFELILESLKRLSSGQQLDQQTFKRVRALIARAPIRVWNEYGHWISLERSWVPVTELAYCYTMQSMFKYGELFPKIKQQTADFQELDVQTISQPPFSDLKPLKLSLSYKIAESPDSLPEPTTKSWTTLLGRQLKHIVLEVPQQQETIRRTAERLEMTEWQVFPNLKIHPYIDGVPAGQAQTPPAFWDGTTLFVRHYKPVKIISAICDEIAPPFNSDAIREAIKMCAERDDAFIEEYLDSTFTFAPDDTLTNSEKLSQRDYLDVTPVSEDLFENLVDDEQDLGDNTNEESQGADITSESEEIDGSDKYLSSDEVGQQKKPATPERTHRSEPSLMDTYIKKFNYLWNEEERRYVHSDGSWLQRGDDGFTWDMYSPEGEIAYRFWVSKHNLDAEGIEIDAGLYGQVKKFPNTSALLLMDSDGQPMILTGENLISQLNNEEVILDPAKYRLRRKSE